MAKSSFRSRKIKKGLRVLLPRRAGSDILFMFKKGVGFATFYLRKERNQISREGTKNSTKKINLEAENYEEEDP